MLFESGKRLESLFTMISDFLPESLRVFVAREMTKLHETFYRGTIKDIKEIVLGSEFGQKGEFVVVIEGQGIKSYETSFDEKRLLEILMKKVDRKLALELASEILDKKRNELYKIKLKN